MATKNTDIEQIIKNHLEGILKRTRSTSEVYQVIAEIIGDVSIDGLDRTTSKASNVLTRYTEKTLPVNSTRRTVYVNFLTFVAHQQSLIDFTMHFAGTVDSEETMHGKLNDGRMIYVLIARFDKAPKSKRGLPEYWLSQITDEPDPSVWVK